MKTSKQGEAEESKKNPSAIPTAGEIHFCCAVKKHTCVRKHTLTEEQHMGAGLETATEQMWI